MASNIILILHVIFAIAIVVLVLIQHGKGADMGAAFGSGSAGSLFGSSGASNFLSKSTGICAALFFSTSLALTYFHAPKTGTGVMGGVTAGVPTTTPAKTEPAKKEASDAIPAPSTGTAPTPAPAPGSATAGAAPSVTPPTPAPAPAPADTKSESKSQQIPK
jgi:preprotein translocase subunit SecG